jgi:hypothetical protein
LLAHVKDRYHVEYSKGHARRLLGKAGRHYLVQD